MSDHRPPPLGWPWDALYAALRKRADAEERLQAATVLAGTVDTETYTHGAAERGAALKAKWTAELDLEEARVEWIAVKQEMARQFVAGLRAALDWERTALAELLGDLPAPPPVVEALSELEDRADATAAHVKTARGECWELANWIARLESDRDASTAGGTHGHRGPGEGAAADDQRDDVRPDHERQAG